MLNQIVLVGRLVKDLEVKDINETKNAIITLAVSRSFKNAETGEYDTDFIDCVLWGGIASNTAEYCRKGDILGVKGRLQNDNIVDNDGNITGETNVVIAEKVTFLSSKKGDE